MSKQTKKQSLIETITSLVIGYALSLISLFIIFPLLGIESSTGKNVLITCYFTVLSFVRSYTIRRYFNKTPAITLTATQLQAIQHQKLEGFPLVETARLQCFECETETPVKYNKGKYYCANCGLKH